MYYSIFFHIYGIYSNTIQTLRLAPSALSASVVGVGVTMTDAHSLSAANFD